MKITLVGIGLGNINTLTIEGYEAIEKADCIIGAARMLEDLPSSATKNTFATISPNRIVKIIKQQPSNYQICVLFSGDVGFYSGAKKLMAALRKTKFTLISGVSSVQYFAAKIKKPWQAWKLVSAHGITCSPCFYVQQNEETFFLSGGENTAEAICTSLSLGGLGDAEVTIGENLSYENERITTGTAAELSTHIFDPLAVVLVKNPHYEPVQFVTSGLSDDSFLRAEAPMTKQEVRSVSLSKLRVAAGDICYDVGAGTGSVTVELAMLARGGHVYAFENSKKAYDLISKNAEKFKLTNITPILNTAPHGISELPPADAVFIGGSGGNLVKIVNEVLAKNPNVRLVINAITLETLFEATRILKELKFQNVEVTQISSARVMEIGKYNMLKGQNPVFIISGEGASDV